jgi:hypothetical protein
MRGGPTVTQDGLAVALIAAALLFLSAVVGCYKTEKRQTPPGLASPRRGWPPEARPIVEALGFLEFR